MRGPGMWMPKQKEGKNWVVNYTVVVNGESKDSARMFRVRQDAVDFVAEAKSLFSKDKRVSSSKFSISKIDASEIAREIARF